MWTDDIGHPAAAYGSHPPSGCSDRSGAALRWPEPGRYVGRFAPSPTGPLHAGSLVAALASWLDARAHGGHWLVRIEDLDRPRCAPGADLEILRQLAACGLIPDTTPLRQSAQAARYQAALDRLRDQGLAYPCGCSRLQIEAALAATGQTPARHGERVYPGTCRSSLSGREPRAWRLRTDRVAEADGVIHWTDRRRGPQHQHLESEVGDFVLRRADGLWAYQLAVVVDDAAQGVTHVVRGEDLADNTPRQIHLQRLLNLATPRYLHTPLVLAADGQKLSKQNGARALDLVHPLQTLHAAGTSLGLPADLPASHIADWLAAATQAWADGLARVGGMIRPLLFSQRDLKDSLT